MGEVEQKAEEGAEKKGLSGEQEKRYVGGVFNRIRKHTPGEKTKLGGLIKGAKERKAAAIETNRQAITALEKQDAELIEKAQKYYDKGQMRGYKKTMEEVRLAGMKKLRLQDQLKEQEKTTSQKRQEARKVRKYQAEQDKRFQEEKKIREAQQRERFEAAAKDKNIGGYFVGEQEQAVARRHNEEDQKRRQAAYAKEIAYLPGSAQQAIEHRQRVAAEKLKRTPPDAPYKDTSRMSREEYQAHLQTLPYTLTEIRPGYSNTMKLESKGKALYHIRNFSMDTYRYTLNGVTYERTKRGAWRKV